MNTDTKVFFTDMDDTLLNRKKEITEKNAEAIRRALSAGHKVVINTGRPLASLKPLLVSLDLEQKGCYASTFNGGLLYDCYEKKVLYRRSIAIDDVKEIFRRADEFGIYCQTYSDDGLLCRKMTEITKNYMHMTGIRGFEDPDLPESLREEPVKILLIDPESREKMDAFRIAMEEWSKGRVSMFYSSPSLLEIVPEHVSKGTAIHILCDYLEVPIENTVAAGDEENDISMLKEAHVGVAMKNAIDTVKAEADYITENDCDHSGVAEAIYKFILEEE